VIGNQPNGYAVDFFRFLVFQDPAWDYRTRPVNLGSDVDRAARVHPSFNPTSPDLSAFVGRGGRLLIYGGWNDVAIPPTANTDYYDAVVAAMGRDRAANAVRLFMVPGMGHCPGTTGPNAVDFDALAIVKDWRRTGQPPAAIVGQRFRNGAAGGQALLCPYPQVAEYRGSGDPGLASSFVCRQP
jgi:feruloyl esterase